MIKLAICLILGIFLAQLIEIRSDLVVLYSIGFLFLFYFGNLLLKKHYRFDILLSIYLGLFTIFIGVFTTTLQNPRLDKNHYINLISKQANTYENIVFSIQEELKPSIYHTKYIIDVQAVDQRPVRGLCLLNISKDSTEIRPQVGQLYYTQAQFKSINRPLNPHQFNYNAYMERQYIYRQLILDSKDIFRLNSKIESIYSYAAFLRQTIQARMEKHNFKPDELAVINALLLGQRQELTQDIYERYAKAGAIHILAISGLHVGLILVILQFLLKPIKRIPFGNKLTIGLIIFLLWSYAIIAGLSASVVRAVTMFSIFAIAMQLKRPTNVYNTLAISVFILLLFKPNFLFDVGFQLSYLAVLAIVILEPLIRRLWTPKFKIITFFWRILTVTLSAQIGVLPLSLYYFHQFPGLFFLSNLVIIPCLGSILGLGILIITLAILKILPDWLAWFYAEIIKGLNDFVAWISIQESFVFHNISFSISHVLLCYSLLFLIIIFIHKKRIQFIYFFLMTILFFQGYLLWSAFYEPSNAFIIFHKSRYTLIGMQKENHLIIHSNLQDSTILEQKFLTNYSIAERVKILKTNPLNNFYLYDSIKLLVVDSLGVYNTKKFKPDVVLLRNSPKINLVRLIDSIHPRLIISDGSNYKSYQTRWEHTCRTKKIPFHQTGKKGAYIYRY